MDRIFTGDALTILKTLPTETVQTCVTSPPYFGLRDYGVKGQIGLETTPELFVQKMVEVFREVRRVLKQNGTLWLNLGDSYAGSGKGAYGDGIVRLSNRSKKQSTSNGTHQGIFNKPVTGLKAKDLMGIPWRVAFALQADGWYLRQDIIWHKPNPMPESVRDRCTKAHEYIFLLSKSPKYYYDCDAIREPLGKDQREAGLIRARKCGYDGKGTYQDWYNNQRQGKDWVNKRESGDHLTFGQAMKHSGTKPPSLPHPLGKNKRSVWTVTPKPYRGAHFATFPSALIKPCILAGSPQRGIVLDPFLGSGTTAGVARELGRSYIGIELNPDYVRLAEQRLASIKSGNSSLQSKAA
jgi:DNA modification methylase